MNTKKTLATMKDDGFDQKQLTEHISMVLFEGDEPTDRMFSVCVGPVFVTEQFINGAKSALDKVEDRLKHIFKAVGLEEHWCPFYELLLCLLTERMFLYHLIKGHDFKKVWMKAIDLYCKDYVSKKKTTRLIQQMECKLEDFEMSILVDVD